MVAKIITILKKLVILTCAIAAVGALAPASYGQGSVVVTYAENPNQQTTSLTGTQTFNFNNLSIGLNTDVNWAGVGSFDQLYVVGANQYGGAADATHPQGTRYAVDGLGGTISQTTLSLNQGVGYFGMYWSAGDQNNVLSFYNGDALVAQYTTASLDAALGSSYLGNPNNRNSDKTEPFAFLNFYGSNGTTWDKIVLTNTVATGFEADNFTVRQNSYTEYTDGPVLPGTPVARVSGTETTVVSPDATGTELWGTAEAIPGLPAPPIGLAVAFGVAAILKARKSHRETAAAGPALE
jgi:hypothetical protein